MCSKKVISIALVLLFFVAMVLSPCISVKADSFPSEFYVNSEVYYSATEIGLAYMSLTDDQKDIANYLMGSYNLFYMGARGFQFKAGTYTNESSFIAKVKALGYRLLYGATEIALYSRFDNDFCKYASAVILYASQCNNVNFDTWFENLDEDFVIPLDQGLINSFTLMYNDNSAYGVQSFGDIETPWYSGTVQEFAFNGWTWLDSYSASMFSSFTNSYTPYIFSKVINYDNSGNKHQLIVGAISPFPNVLYILRGDSYGSFRYGYVNNGVFSKVTNQTYATGRFQTYDNKLRFFWNANESFNKNIISATANSDLSDFIEYVFNNYTPIPYYSIGDNNIRLDFRGDYPFIGHVVLVDNLDTLSNPTEVYNVDSWDLQGDIAHMLVPIDKVGMKPKHIVEIDLPDNSMHAVDIQEIIDDQGDIVDDDDNPVNPWQITVVVQPNDTNPISVDVNMFNGGTAYIDYLWGHTMKMAQYAKDLLDCFDFTVSGGESYGPKYAIYGVLVLGIAGGLVAKFLL